MENLTALRHKMFVVRFGELGHLLLHRRRHKRQVALASLDAALARESHEARHRRVRRHHRPVLDQAAVLQRAPTPHDHVLANVHVRSDQRRRYDGALADVHMIADVERKESQPRAELLVRRPDDGPLVDHTEATSFHVGQIAANDGACLHDDFSVQNDVLRAAQNGVAADLVAGGLRKRGWVC